MEVLGIIPARGGSKSIPLKNIADLAGKPLLAYTAQAARASQRLTRIVLSTDDERIARVANEWGVEVPFLRPSELAQDHTPALPVIFHVLDELRRRENYDPDIVVLLQPTSPLRTAAHIDEAVDLLRESGADSVVSVVEVPHQYSPISVMKSVNDRLTPYHDGPMALRRQDKPRVYARNGPAVLAIKRETILNKQSLYGDHTRAIVMTHEESIDIDSLLDLELAHFFLKRRM